MPPEYQQIITPQGVLYVSRSHPYDLLMNLLTSLNGYESFNSSLDNQSIENVSSSAVAPPAVKEVPKTKKLGTKLAKKQRNLPWGLQEMELVQITILRSFWFKSTLYPLPRMADIWLVGLE
ncbi:hypothetical protein PNOK_0318300 [Pyrrhoderma noxium]|uniref:Uncharacterized protein n=1 Tax=Pyrrhoderma noxium TaxID=2282107 RepID=A0A286ULR0_9AGAM|nr:hypothetical protein PNOK_0318300 [Pyrrhoderma noxium]